jgi:hypothetical protein
MRQPRALENVVRERCGHVPGEHLARQLSHSAGDEPRPVEGQVGRGHRPVALEGGQVGNVGHERL